MVAIKNMEMPKNCAECKLFHFYLDSDSVIHYICKCGNMEMYGTIEKYEKLKNKRSYLCPLIEVNKEDEE